MCLHTKINDLVSSLSDDKRRVCIMTHDTPDPDALGAAFGMQWLLKKKFDVSSSIFYGGEISHPQNKTMVNTLNLATFGVS